jgi:uncharacterized protein (DUF4415 family)
LYSGGKTIKFFGQACGKTERRTAMGIVTSLKKSGEKPPKEVQKQIREIEHQAKKQLKKKSSAQPDSTDKALKEPAAEKTAKKKKDKLKAVEIRLQPEILEKYKALGRGYTDIMADVLKLAVEDPDILSKLLA